jgi:hypothetical protein
MSVLLGGASWSDVLASYFMLSVQGLVLTSMALLFSSITERAVSALLYTYGGVIAYLAGTGTLAAMTQNWNAAGEHKSFFQLLNPFTIFEGLGGSTLIAGLPVPNMVLAAATCFVMIRLFLASAGAALVPPRPRERADLRLSAVATLATAVGLTTFLVAGIQSNNANNDTLWLGMIVFMFTIPLAIFMPFLSCYGLDSERNARPNGIVSFSKTLTGTPASALTFTWFVVGASLVAAAVGASIAGVAVPYGELAVFGFYIAAFWSFFWAMGRLASSFLMGLKASRTMQFLSFVAVVAGPIPILTYLGNRGGMDEMWHQFPWNLYILSPLFWNATMVPGLVIWGTGLSVMTALVAWWSEVNLRQRLSRKGAGLSEIERATGRFADNAGR